MFNNRMAVKDDVLPLAKPYIDKAGKSHDSLPSVQYIQVSRI